MRAHLCSESCHQAPQARELRRVTLRSWLKVDAFADQWRQRPGQQPLPPDTLGSLREAGLRTISRKTWAMSTARYGGKSAHARGDLWAHTGCEARVGVTLLMNPSSGSQWPASKLAVTHSGVMINAP